MFSFKVAVRFLRSGRLQTVLIIVGIAIAISVQVFVGLLIDSLQKSLVASTMGNSPHITITSARDDVTIRRWESIVDQIKLLDSVDTVSVAASANAFAKKGDATKPVLIRGFNFEDADRIYHISGSIYGGNMNKLRSEVLVGKDLGEELEVGVGDKLNLVLPNGTAGTYTISGFYDLGVSSVNKTWVIMQLDTAQSILGFVNRVTSIDITVDDLFHADLMARELERRLSNSDIKVENWKEQNQQLLRGLEGQRVSSTIIQAIILVSVVTAISSILTITVMQRSRQIGILKAMGMKDFAAGLIFLYQGFLVGLAGSVLGVGLGLGLLYGFAGYTTSATGAPVVELYIGYDFIVRSWLIVLLSATLAGIIPASRSLKLNPVDVIREG